MQQRIIHSLGKHLFPSPTTGDSRFLTIDAFTTLRRERIREKRLEKVQGTKKNGVKI